MFDRIVGAKVNSKRDLNKIPSNMVSPVDIEKTAFNKTSGLFKYNITSIKAWNAHYKFQTFFEQELYDRKGKFAVEDFSILIMSEKLGKGYCMHLKVVIDAI